MNKVIKTNIFLFLLILILLITIISFSFAYFNANILSNETNTTITTGSGIMEITYSSGDVINITNVFPNNNPFVIKEFTITGKNSNDENMHYHLLLVLDENTFKSSALTYTLKSNNIDDNGYTVPEIITQTGIKTDKREIFLGNGMFTPTNNEDKVHSYTLKLYFPKIENFEHGIDQGKIFKAHIETREGKVYPGYNEEKGVNHPVLFTGMTPVKWNENNEETQTTSDDPDWYDYNEKRWANAKSADGSYWVWIPRYAYKIESCYHKSSEDCLLEIGKEAGDIDIKFLKSNTNFTEDGTIIETTGYIPHEKDTSMHHFLHPAFKFNGEELGFWAAKFEPSPKEGLSTIGNECDELDNVSTKTIEVKPNSNPWRCVSNYNAFKATLNMRNKSLYGWLPNELDSHMATNIEWGALVYLSRSNYGADGEIWNNSYLDFKTGCAGSSVDAISENICNEYNTSLGIMASTTYNIYGVYDTSGGSEERTMANRYYEIAKSGFNLKELMGLEAKYITKYEEKDGFVYGDAIYETSGETGAYSSWFRDNSVFPSLLNGWFHRGGHINAELRGGIFYYQDSSGSPRYINTFRPILTPLIP